MQQQSQRPEDVSRELNEIKAKLIVSERDRKHASEELKQAMRAEENTKKAMEDLALALKEVAAESSVAKEKLRSTEQQLEAVKEEARCLKTMIKSTEETYEAMFKEQKKENDQLVNIVNRLSVEAEESQLAWSCKEMEFVKCIKQSEDEKNVAEEENRELIQRLREAQLTSEKYREESIKLRDILKQAINEANVAKEAASLARTENSFLKDALAVADKETERFSNIDHNDAEAVMRVKEQDKQDIHTPESLRLDVVDSPPSYYPRTTSAPLESFDDKENVRSSSGKKRALLRRFGELLKGKGSRSPKDVGQQQSLTRKEIAA